MLWLLPMMLNMLFFSCRCSRNTYVTTYLVPTRGLECGANRAFGDSSKAASALPSLVGSRSLP